MNKFTKQCVAAFASLAMAGTLCVAGAVVAGSSAWADTQTACTANKAPWATDQTKNCVGSILIHKTDDAAQPNGLNGVTFTIKKVAKLGTGASATGLDLKDKDQWVTLASKVGELNAAAQAGNPESKVTFDETFGDNQTHAKSEPTKNDTFDAADKVDGVAKFTNLPLGLYYVAETGPLEGYSPKFSPFFITVPEITRGATDKNNKYNYTVKVSPKNWNAKEGIKKDAVTGDIVGVGDTLPYKITAKVTLPADADTKTETTGTKSTYFLGSNINGFKIWDDALIDAYEGISGTSYTPDATVTVGEYDAQKSSFKTIAGATNPETLTKDTDYTVTVTDSEVDKGTAATRKRILFEFTEAGRNKIAKKFGTNANTDIRVQVILKFKLKSDYGAKNTETVLENKYGFNPGGKGGKVPDITGKTTETKLHKFHIFKYDGTTENSNTKKPLKDAQFKVFTESKKNDADACAKDPSAQGACATAMTGFVDAKNTTAGKTGTITTTGEDGKTADYVAKEGEKFYVVEIKAPDGFARSEKVYEVTVPATAKDQTAAVYEYAIANVPSNDGDFWFKLPKTGAAGVTIFAIAGMGLVGIGIFVFMRNRKKDEEQQNA